MTNTARHILPVLLFLLPATIYAHEPRPIFRVSFDNGFSADMANGNPRGTPSLEEVNLETLGALLKKGVAGRALVTGVAGMGVAAKRMYCAYQAKGNIRLEQGSIHLWVKPIDWSGDDKYYHNFFAAEGKDSLLYIYKFQNVDELLFIYGRKGKTPEGRWRFSATRQVISDWVPDRWQFISCTWGKGMLRLYLNGEPCSNAKIEFPPATPFEIMHVGDMIKPWPNTAGISHIDEIEIYSNIMTREQVYAKWLKARELLNPGKISLAVGNKTPVVDGMVHDREYAFSGTGFFNLNGTLAEAQGRYYLAYDNRNLYVGVKTGILGNLRANIRERDGKLWRDDSIEIFLMPGQGANDYFQFIFNPAGVFLDGRSRAHDWNASTPPRIANRIEKNEWTFETAIPFAALGIAPPGDGDTWKFNICRTYPAYRLYTSLSPIMNTYHDYMNFAKLTFRPDTPQLCIRSMGRPSAGTIDLTVAAITPETDIDVAVRFESAGKILVQAGQRINPGKELSIKRNGFIPQGRLKISASHKGAAVFSSTYEFRKTDPLKVEYVVTRIRKKLLRARIKHTRPLTGPKNVLALRLRRKTGEVVRETLLTPRQLMYFIDLTIDGIPPGDYAIEITYTDERHRALFKYGQDYTIPHAPPAWLDNRIGITNKVPPPWTPMLVTGSDVRCWGRVYSFAESLLPAQIEAQGKKLLAANMQLKLNGEPVSGATTMIFAEKARNRVRLTTSLSNEQMQISCNTLIEYDGFTWFDLTLTPTRPLAVGNLTLEIPCNPHVTTLVHSMKKGYLYAKKGSGAIPAKTWRRNIFRKPIVWVGDEAVGLQWFAQTLEGWMVKNRDESMRIIRQNNAVLLELSIIDYPVTLTHARRISFGIMATPVRPRQADWRSMRFGPDVQPWFMYTSRFNYPDRNFLRKDFAQARRWYPGKRVCYYHALYSASPFVPEMPYWMERWKLTPPLVGMYGSPARRETAEVRVCMNSSTYRDFYLHKLSRAVDDLGIKHLYFDLGVPRSCENREHGCGWQDETGAWHKTYNILGTRAIAKRIYVMMKQKHPNAIIINHMSEEPVMPVLSFCTCMVEGELYCKQVAEERGYYNILSPAWFRAEFMARALGPPSFFIPQFKRGAELYLRGSEKFWDTSEAEKPYNHLKGYILVHDSKCWPHFGLKLDDVFRIQDAFGWDEKLKFFGYWRKDNPVKVRNLKTDRVMCSTYTRPGKAMVIVMNDTDGDDAFTLQINRTAFTRANSISATDAYTSERLPVTNATVNLKVTNRGFRILILQ